MATLNAAFLNNLQSLSVKKGFGKKDNVKEDFVVSGEKLKYVQDRAVGSYILERLEVHNHQIAQIDPISGDCTTFNDIRLLSLKLAQGLRNCGIGKGDVVAICSYNNLDVCLPMLAALYVGASVMPLHSSLSRPDLKHLLAIGRPKIIFADFCSIEIVGKSMAELRHLNADLIIFGGTKIHKSLERFLDEQCDGNNNLEQFVCENPWEDCAFIVPTNGTTHLPKLVNISHGSILHHLQSHWDEDWYGFTILNTSTIYTITGIKSMLTCLDHGIEMLLSPEFNPKLIASIITDWKLENPQKLLILIIGCENFKKLINFSEILNYNLSLQLIIIYGNRLTDLDLKLFETVFGIETKLFLGYGSVETTGMCTIPNDKKFSVGSPDPDMEFKIIDTETGRPLGPSIPGELYIRGKRLMINYYNDPLATADAITKDGWYRTGDLAYYDDLGNFFITGRILDQFFYKNCLIEPFEIEKILIEHSEIKEICIIGIKNKFDGARAKAFIVREEGSTISESRIRKYLEGQLSPLKQLWGGIVFLDKKLPVTPSGKVNKRLLVKLLP